MESKKNNKPMICKSEEHRLKKISKTRSQTFPQVIFWLLLAILMCVFEYFFNMGENLKSIINYAGAASFAYLSISYCADFLSNRRLPEGLGEIKDIKQYRLVSWVWCIVLLVAIIFKYIFSMHTLPIENISFITACISTTYISGNKSNKIATVTHSMGEK